MHTPVLLLRAPAADADPYDAALRASSLSPRALPVLETSLSTAGLAEILQQGHLSGAILTSQRAVEAWGRAADDLLARTERVDSVTPWPSVPFYTVGPATARALVALATPARAALCPADVRGAHTGTAEALARFIVSDQPKPSRLLYLTGDKNRDTLPKIVAEEGGGRIELCEEQVYATRGVALDVFESALGECMKDVADNAWIVFFSPSSAAHVLPVLHAHFRLVRSADTNAPDLLETSRPTARIAAIGPTTADYLRDECALVVHAVPNAPSAEALARALRDADAGAPS